MSEPDRIERFQGTSRALVAEFDEMRTRAEEVMAALARTRAWLVGIAPGVGLLDGEPAGSPDAVEASVSTLLGLDELDAARRRLLAALADPMDDVPRPELT